MVSRKCALVCALAVILPCVIGDTANEQFATDSVLGARVKAEAPELNAPAPRLSDEQWDFLNSYGWGDRVRDEIGVWVSVDEQMFRIVQGRDVLFETRCATAKNGTGSEWNSLKTPLGWHHVVQKVGAGAPRGQVFRGRQATNEIWRPGDSVAEDLVLTRVLVLTGDEPGKNKGGNVDSLARGIYVHGTNAEELIGTPSSHGCVRLTNGDVVTAFERVPEKTPVLITERAKPKKR